jgi:hypothetical protein
MPTTRFSEIAAQAEREAERKVKAVLAEGAKLSAAERTARNATYERGRLAVAQLVGLRALKAGEEADEEEEEAVTGDNVTTQPAEPQIPPNAFTYRTRDIQNHEWMAENAAAYSKAAHEGRLHRLGD